MSNVWLSVLLVVSSAMIGNLVIYGWGRRRTPGVFYFCLLMMAMIFHSLGYAFELLSDTVDSMYFWIKIEYLGALILSFFNYDVYQGVYGRKKELQINTSLRLFFSLMLLH